MGLLDSLVGGAMGAGALQLVESTIQKHGGVQGLVQAFESGGLGNVARSWVSNGPNQSVTPDQVQQALGADKVQSMATAAGVDKNTFLAQLAQHLPGAVDKLTPNGTIA